jgi:flagellin
MALTVNTNVSSLNAQRNLSASQASLTTSMQRLSSGLRINSAKDDAAGLSISERFTSQIRGNDQASRNANDGISLAQTAEGDLDQIGNNLQRMRELAVQSANGTNSASDRQAIDNEVQSLSQEIDRVAQNSSFNGIKLLDGSFANKAFQVGANATAADTITIGSIGNARTNSLGQFNGFNQANLGAITFGAASALSVTLAGPGTVVPLGTVATDAKDIAAAINASGIQGLTAAAAVNTKAAGVSALTGGSLAGTSIFTINGTNITLTTGGAAGSAATNRASALTQINLQSSLTGVVATDNGTGLSLTAADGRNIITAFAAGTSAGAVAADYGLAAAANTVGTVTATYLAATGVTGVTVAGAGLAGTLQSVASTGTSVSATNVLTAANATSALNTIDAAINSINTSRASLGSYQNRFESTIASLQTTTENLTASRGRIKDADFAKETSNLSRAQVLQQAGTAMLAQANQSSQGVLSLLR